ncbi:MAG: hypothetical protein FJW76_02705 [Actinobacteria bacterium]|nr:hypothetical protein [Actinomycetota bacterium]
MVKQLAQYELTERIKQQNGASWWRGWDNKLERDVSIWTIPHSDPRLPKLKSSAAQAANLSDPRILRVLDVVEDSEVFAVVSEWAHGVTISERVLGRAPLKNAKEIVLSLIECISSAHNQQVYHLALTADDIVLTNSGIKIRGFGIASVLNESQVQSTPDADIAAVGAIGYASVTGTWPLLTKCALPAAPVTNGLVAKPSQLTPKLPAFWDNFVFHTVPTINTNLTYQPVSQLASYLQDRPKEKLTSQGLTDLPSTKISRRGLITALFSIAALFITGYLLVFSSLSGDNQTNPLSEVETGTDLRNEELPVATLTILRDGNLKTISGKRPFTLQNGQAIQIQLKERRTVQRVELDLVVGGANFLAQVTDTAVTIKSDNGKLGDINEAPTTAIIFGPRFITGNFITVWVELPEGGSVEITRVATYGTPS